MLNFIRNKIKLITIILLWVIVVGLAGGYAAANGVGMVNWGNIWPVVAVLAVIGMGTLVWSTKIKTVWKSVSTVLFILLVLFGLGVATQAPSPYHLKVGLSYGATGRTATYVIAASDATALEKAQADATCTGTNDQTVINAELVTLSALGGTQTLSLIGDFTCNGVVVAKPNVNVQGILLPSNS